MPPELMLRYHLFRRYVYGKTKKTVTEKKKTLIIQGHLAHYKPGDAQDVQAMLRDLLGDTLQEMLEAEMDEHLGYSKYRQDGRRCLSGCGQAPSIDTGKESGSDC